MTAGAPRAAGTVRILEGDAVAMLRTLEPASVQCVITSPPFYRLRDYGVDGQIGLEDTPQAFLERLYAVFEECRRVMRDDALLFVNLADSYAGSGKGPTGANGIGDQGRRQGFVDVASRPDAHTRAKSLYLIPERFAIGMADRGWIVRQQVVWAKAAPMPESVRDRMTSAWEPIWMFSQQGRYYFDQEAVRQPNTPLTVARHSGTERRYADHKPSATIPPGHPTAQHPDQHHNGLTVNGGGVSGANLRNVWHLSPEPSRLAHYASYPTELVRRCVLMATSEKGGCPSCGAPWRRLVEREPSTTGDIRPGKSGAYILGGNIRADGKKPHPADQTWRGRLNQYAQDSATVGWEPGCTCEVGPPRPQVVLDPFLGSGTTALVAHRLGRSAVGIDLNPQYCELARRRIESDERLFSGPVVLERHVQPELLPAHGGAASRGGGDQMVEG